MDNWIPDKCKEEWKLAIGRPSYQDIHAGVQLRLPTHELKVLETVALTSCFCVCTPKVFSVTLSLPQHFKPFSSTRDQLFFCKFLEVPICCISWTETTSCAAGCQVVKLTENGSERTLFPLRHKTDFD